MARKNALSPLLTKLLDGHILADINTAAELNAKSAYDVDLRAHHVFFEAEGRNSVHHHAAYALALFKYGRAMSFFARCFAIARVVPRSAHEVTDSTKLPPSA